jgi:hypothetical protein
MWREDANKLCMLDGPFKNLTLIKGTKSSKLWPFNQSKLYRWLLAPHCGNRMCFHEDVETYELNLNNISSDERETLFHDFFPKEKTKTKKRVCSLLRALKNGSAARKLASSAAAGAESALGTRAGIWLSVAVARRQR